MRQWRPVTRRERCPVCDQPDWCAVSTDGRVARCMRVIDGDGVIPRQDSAGTPYGLRFLVDGPADPTRYQPDPEPARADDDTLHRVYSKLLACLSLSPTHRAALRARGLDDATIDRNDYRTLPPPSERRRVVADARAEFGGTIPADVPGLWRGKLSGAEGIVIPVRDHVGRVRALKVRADDDRDGKYRWISSSHDDGPSPGAPAHVPYFAGETQVVRVTEGPLKADVATRLSGVLTIGVAGCTSTRSAVDHLRGLRAREVRLAWDADARDNRHVAAGLKLSVDVLRSEGFSVVVETWDASVGKGIDDALAAGAAITTHSGDAVDRVVREMCESAANVDAKRKSSTDTPQPAPNVAAEVRARGARAFDRGDSVELAHALLEDLSAGAPDAGDDAVVFDRSTFWVYDPARGIYVEHTEAQILCRVMAFAGSPVGPKGKPLALSDGSARGALKAASWLCARPGYLSEAPRGIVFADRFVTAEDGDVVRRVHSHTHRAIHALPLAYDDNATCPRWMETLREVFRRLGEDGAYDYEDTENCIAFLQEWVGSTLLGEATSRAVSLVLTGNGNDGKSTVLNVVRSLFPPSSVSSIAPQEWSRSFLLAELAGKRLNVVSELPERDILDGERFKAVVSGDPLTAERKNKDPFQLITEAGQLFACNALPATRDQSEGFWRRFAVLACMRRFTAAEAVRDLWKRIVEEELDGVAAWAIEGAARIQRQERFTMPASSTEAKAEWQQDADAVRQFVADACVVLTDESQVKESGIGDLYTAFRAWAAETGHAIMARDKLAKRLKVLGYEHRTKTARLYRLAPIAPEAKSLTGAQKGAYGGAYN